MQFHEARLPNGLEIIAELTPSVYSVALSFIVKTGARDETAEVSGVSHFLEHMAFKGDSRFSAEDVNRIFDEVGAKYNAATAEDVTLYYAAVLPEYLETTFELLATLIRPSLRQEDFDVEKQVIIEEIGMYDDQPTFVAYEKALQLHFAGHPLGHSILGTKESITALTSEQMRAYHSDRYRGDNFVLVVAGNTDWQEIQRLADKYCGQWPGGSPGRVVTTHKTTPATEWHIRDSVQQQHMMSVCTAPPARHPLRQAAELLAIIVGDDSGSRLFWELVDPGYVETAEFAFQEYDGNGVFRAYFNGPPEATEANFARLQRVLQDVQQNGVTVEELDQARNKLLSRIVLSGERPLGRLDTLGNNWIYRGCYLSLADDLAQVRKVTPADIRTLLDEFPLQLTTIVGVGPRGEVALQPA